MDEQFAKLKIENEFKNTIKNTRNLIKRDTTNIPDLDSLNDGNKGIWVEHEPNNFNKIFEGLLDYCADEECFDNLDWNSVNYTTYGPDYYEEKFPGFEPAVYEILAKSTEEENKIKDSRVPHLRIKEEEVVLSFK